MQMPRFKMDALGGSRATSGKNNRQLNNGTASFMETIPEIDRPRLETEMANAPPSAPPPPDGKGFVYWARFDPPLQTRAYPHLGDHVLVGWLLLTERPLPPMAAFNVRRREADLHAHHSVDILPWSPDGSGAHAFDGAHWAVAQRFHDTLFGWVKKPPRPGLTAPAEALLARCGVRFLPALAPMADASATVGWLSPPPELTPDPSSPVAWELIQLFVEQRPFSELCKDSLAAFGSDCNELRARAREAVAARRAATAAAASGDEAAAAAAAEAAEAAADRADEVAIAARRCVQGRVVLLSHTGGTYLINDIDCIRTAHSPMPRRSAHEKPSTFAEYNHRKWGVVIEQPELPMVTVGNNLCVCNCRVDDQHLSFAERFGASYEEGKQMNAEQTRHHTFLIGELVLVTGFTAEVSAEYNSLLLPEIAWNLAVWDQLAQLEKRLGYTFLNKGLLREALTHACYANQVSKEQSEHDSKAMQMGLAGARYERLEWLGDVVLKALSSHHIFHRTNPLTQENHLHRMRGQLISNRHLHNVGERMGLAPLMLRVEGQEVTFKMLADVVEALLGSIYLEAGWRRAQHFFEDFILCDEAAKEWRPERWRPLKFAPAQRAVHDRLRANVAALAARGVAFAEGKVAYVEHVLLHPSVVTATERAARQRPMQPMEQMQLASMCRDPQVQPPHPQPMPFQWPRQQLQQPSPDDPRLPARNGGLNPGAAALQSGWSGCYGGGGISWGAPPPPPPPLPPTLDQQLEHSELVWWAGGDRSQMAHQFERMEWLGDALLDLIVAEELYKRFPRDNEGSLSLRKQLIVRNDVLSIASQRLELTTLLLHSRERIATSDAERQRSMAERSKLDRTVNTEKRNGPNKWQADVFEALVCALYLANTDRTAERSGFEAAAQFVKKELLDAVVERSEANSAFQTQLAERWQQEAQALTMGGVGTSWREDKARDEASQAAQAPAGSKGKKRKHAATGALDEVSPKYAKQEEKHPKAMLQEILHQADMGVVEYHEWLAPDGRVAVDVYLNGQKLTETPTLGVDFKAASAAAAKGVITQLQAAQGPADPDAAPPEKPKHLRPQDKGGRPGDGTVPSGGGGSADGSQHPRTLLQELVHAFPALGELRYDQLEDAGLNQPGRYLVGITLGGQLVATARGRNKKDASTVAAAEALKICQERVAGMERRQTYAPATMGGGAA